MGQVQWNRKIILKLTARNFLFVHKWFSNFYFCLNDNNWYISNKISTCLTPTKKNQLLSQHTFQTDSLFLAILDIQVSIHHSTLRCQPARKGIFWFLKKLWCCVAGRVTCNFFFCKERMLKLGSIGDLIGMKQDKHRAYTQLQ